MQGWLLLWKMVFGLSALLFLGVTVVVAVRGFGDTYKLFHETLHKQGTQEVEDKATEPF